MPYQKIRFECRRQGNQWEGTIELPLSAMRAVPGMAPGGAPMLMPGGRTQHRIKVQAKGATKGAALNRAAGIAESLLDNPILQAALPPGSGAAISAVKMLAKSGIAKGLKNLTGKGAKRIASALKFW